MSTSARSAIGDEMSELVGSELETGRARLPALPVEMLSHVAESVAREDLPALCATSRVWREVARPLLFEALSIKGENGEEMLSLISEDNVLAACVRTLQVSLPSDWRLQVKSIVPSALAAALRRFHLLQSLTYNAHGLALELQRAIVSHPSLRTLTIGPKLLSAANYDLDLFGTFPRKERPALVITSATYPITDCQPTVTPAIFFARLVRYDIRVPNLHLHSGTAWNVEAVRILPSIADFGLTSLFLLLDPDNDESSNTIPLGEDATWLHRLLGAHPSLTLLSLALGNCHVAYCGPPSHLENATVPWTNLSAVDDADLVVSPALEDWFDSASAEEIEITFRRMPERTKIIKLCMSNINVNGGGTIPADALAGMAAFLPDLESLTLAGFYGLDEDGRDEVESEYPELLDEKPEALVASLLQFPNLVWFQLPFAITVAQPTDLCFHDTDTILDHLLDVIDGRVRLRRLNDDDVSYGLEPSPDDPSPDEIEEAWTLFARLARTDLFWGRFGPSASPRAMLDEVNRPLLSHPSLQDFVWDLKCYQASLFAQLTYELSDDGTEVYLTSIDKSEERDPEVELDEWKCWCPHLWPGEGEDELLGYLERVKPLFVDPKGDPRGLIPERRSSSYGPLFSQWADFTPAFTLDRFVSRS